MKRTKRRPLTFEPSNREQQAINGGSHSRLSKLWQGLFAQLEKDERIYAEWKKRQFSNWCQMIITDPADLRLLIEGMVVYGAHEVHLYAELNDAPLPAHVHRDHLFN